MALVVKNLPANDGDARDVGSIPGEDPRGRSPGAGSSTCSSILAWGIPWTEDLRGYRPGLPPYTVAKNQT